MNHKRYKQGFLATLLSFILINVATANEVGVLAADLRNSSGDWWTTNVTILHKDTGWEHYADSWRVIDKNGKVFGTKVLRHPHVNEQPFTRGTADIKIPKGTTTVYIEGHDTVHGWSPNRLEIDMTRVINGYVRVIASSSAKNVEALN